MAAYQGNTLGLPLVCPPHMLDHITVDVLRDYRARFYQPERIVLAAAGVHHEEFVRASPAPPAPLTSAARWISFARTLARRTGPSAGCHLRPVRSPARARATPAASCMSPSRRRVRRRAAFLSPVF
jgi:processing peptidase subunit alpha